MNSFFTRNCWLAALLVVFLLVGAVNIFLLPLLNSGDEFYLMYTLAGGYGEEPTHLLHMDHIWHPILGSIIAWLFKNFPGINWYALFLLLCQWLAGSAILYVFLKRSRPVIALSAYFIIFYFIQVRALLSLNFSFCSWIIATAGSFLLWHSLKNNGKKLQLVIALIFLLISSLMRLHILFAVIIVFSPFFLTEGGLKLKRWLPILSIVCIVGLLLNAWHKQYYRKHIPGWEQEEKMRQAIYYPSNRTINFEKPWASIFRDSTERAFYAHLFFYDSTVISIERMNEIGKSLARVHDFSQRDDWQSLYWFYVGWRIYLLLFAVIFFLLWQYGVLKEALRRWRIPALLVMGIYIYLFIFLKITDAIHLGTLLILLLTLAGSVPAIPARPVKISAKWRFLLIVLPFAWMSIRIYERNQANKQGYAKFRSYIADLNRQHDKLFLATDDALPLGSFYIWDLPSKNKLTNLVYKDRLLTNTYPQTLQRYGITDLLEAAWLDPRVYLTGRSFPELENYLRQKYPGEAGKLKYRIDQYR